MEIQADRCRYLMDDGCQCPNRMADGSHFCEQHAAWMDADLAVYKSVTEHFRQDVREFWSRSNFYLVVQAGLLSVFASLEPQSSRFEKGEVLTLGALGLILAVVWYLVSRGSLLWLRRWRAEAIAIDDAIDRHHSYARVEAFASEDPLMSPSNITQFLPLLFCAGWIVLLYSVA